MLKRICAPLLTVATCTILVKLAGAAKVLIIARHFGLDVDEYLIAFVVLMFFAEAISGATTASLVPVLVSLREQRNDVAARSLFSTTTTLIIAQLSAVAMLLILLSGFVLRLVASGFDAEKTAETEWLLIGMAPVLLFSGLSAAWRGVLNSAGRFALPAITPTLTPALTILLLGLQGSSATVQTLAVATLAGSAAELMVISWQIRREGYSLLPRWLGNDESLRRVLRQYGPMLASALILSGSALVSYSMAATLGPGSVTALTYGGKVVAAILAIGPASLATVALPHFSGLAAKSEWSAMAGALAAYHRLILLTMIPATLILFMFSETITRVLFEHNAFTAHDTRIVGGIQSLYVLQLPFAMLSALLFRVISSIRANDVLMWGAGLHLIVSTLLTYLYMQWRGAPGIALATSIAVALQYVYLKIMLFRLMKPHSCEGQSSNVFGGVVTGVIQSRTD